MVRGYICGDRPKELLEREKTVDSDPVSWIDDQDYRDEEEAL